MIIVNKQMVFAACAITMLLTSCYSSRMAKINEAINNTNQLQEKENISIKEIENSLVKKLDEGDIDSTINKKVVSRLSVNKASMDTVRNTMEEIKSKTKSRKELRKSYRKIIKSKLVYLSNDNKRYQQKAVNYGMIADALNNSKQSQFDLATFFGPGEFLIPADKVQQASNAFRPIIDSVIKFAGKYPEINKNATIVLKGYADAQGFKTGTPLYYRLCNEIPQVDKPDNAALNLALSKLRTTSINGIVNSILKEKQQDVLKQKIISVELIEEGRGQEKPNPKISDYTDDDPRRRIVLFFWSLLPI